MNKWYKQYIDTEKYLSVRLDILILREVTIPKRIKKSQPPKTLYCRCIQTPITLPGTINVVTIEGKIEI